MNQLIALCILSLTLIWPFDTWANLKLKAIDGSAIVKVKQTETAIKVTTFHGTTEKTLKGKGDQSKRTYKDEAGKTLYVAKGTTQKLKLKSASGDVLWKVKSKQNKLKISIGEKPATLIIKQTSQDKLKLESQGNVYGTAKMKSGKISFKNPSGTKILYIKDATLKLSHGILGLQDIPPDQRGILMIELNLRGL